MGKIIQIMKKENQKYVACPQEDFLFKIHHKASWWLKRGYPMKFADSTQNFNKFIGTPN
jgi:hypothetical protein